MYIQNVPVYAGNTRTCFSTCARAHTERFGRTHGDVLDGHMGEQGGGHLQSCLPKFAHVWLSLFPEVHQRNFWIFCILSLRKDREQHVPDSSNHSLYLINLFYSGSPEGTAEGISYWVVRFVFRPFLQSISNDLHVSTAAPPGSLLTFPFSGCVHHLSSPNTCLTQTTFKTTECAHTHIHTRTHTCTYTYS